MKNKALLASASSVAIAAVGASEATAQMMDGLGGYKLAVQGGGTVLNNPFYDKTEGIFSGAAESYEEKAGVNDHIGGMGSIALSRQISQGSLGLSSAALAGDLDARIALGFGAASNQDDKTENIFSGGGSGSLVNTSDVRYLTADLEIGNTVRRGTTDVRMFAGVRALDWNSELNKAGAASGGGSGLLYDITEESSFRGIGPRAGVGFYSHEIFPGMPNIGLSGHVGAAALFGEREDGLSGDFATDKGGSGFSGGSGSTSDSNDERVVAVDAQVAMSYYFNPNSAISVGVEMQQFWNVDTSSDSDRTTFADAFLDDFEGDLGDVVDGGESFFGDQGPRIIRGVFLGFKTAY